MPIPQEQFEQELGAQMKKSPLDISVDGGRCYITIIDGMRIENIGVEHEQPKIDTRYDLGSKENLTLQTISTNNKKTIYTFTNEGDQIIVTENTRTEPSTDKTFEVDGHKVTVGIDNNGYTYIASTLPLVPNEKGFVKIGDSLVKADKALGTKPHLIIQKKYSLF